MPRIAPGLFYARKRIPRTPYIKKIRWIFNSQEEKAGRGIRAESEQKAGEIRFSYFRRDFARYLCYRELPADKSAN